MNIAIAQAIGIKVIIIFFYYYFVKESLNKIKTQAINISHLSITNYPLSIYLHRVCLRTKTKLIIIYIIVLNKDVNTSNTSAILISNYCNNVLKANLIFFIVIIIIVIK